MARDVYVLREGKLVPKHLAQPLTERREAPNVIPDGMGQDLWHPATGRYADSKSEFRRMTKESGCVEMGNDIKAEPRKQVRLSRQERADAIRAAIEQLRAQG